MDNLILVHLWLEEGCSQEEKEVSMSWKPINFMIYSSLFQDMVTEAVDGYLLGISMEVEELTEVIFRHVVDMDAGGAVLEEYLEPVKISGPYS